jgi:hypothetical protein
MMAHDAQVAVVASPRPITQGDSASRAPTGASGIDLRSASLLVRPRLATVETATVRSSAVATAAPGAMATPTPAASARAKAAPAPSATPRPRAATPASTTTRATKPVVTAPAATPRPAPKRQASPPAIVYQHRAAGTATWGHFGGAVITRLAPGTHIRVCGRIGCWEGVSTGYGPSRDGGNLVDLDAAVFRRICGPLGVGVGSIVLSWR